MTHRRALVDHLDAGLLERGQVGLRVAPGGLDDLDAGVDDGLHVVFVRHRTQRGQDGQVDAEGFVGQVAGPLNFFEQLFRRRLRERSQKTEGTGVGHRGDQGRAPDTHHASHDDRVLDSEFLRESRLDHVCPPSSAAQAFRRRPAEWAPTHHCSTRE